MLFFYPDFTESSVSVLYLTGKKRYGNVLTGYKAIMLPRFDSSEK